MPQPTPIEWTEQTWNFLRGCSRVSEGCRNCYAEKVAARFSDKGLAYHGIAKRREFVGDLRSNWTGEVSFHEDILLAPLKRKKPTVYFVNSMSDLFHEKVQDEWLDVAFAVMALTPHHTYQVLTKRPQRMLRYWTHEHGPWGRIAYQIGMIAGQTPGLLTAVNLMQVREPLPNTWLGVSIENQKTADERIPCLLETPAAVRWLSMEPLLGPVTVWGDDGEGLLRGPGVIVSGGMTPSTPDSPPEGYDDSYLGIDWIVVGGESGQNARPMHPEWARSIRDQCHAAGVPFFFKQWGAWQPDHVFDNIRTRGVAMKIDGSTPTIDDMKEMLKGPSAWFEEQHFSFVGKKKAGRILDGREWSEMPEVVR